MIEAVMEYTFLQNAVYSAILASIVCGIIGTIVIEKRLVMMSGGIAHTSFGGIGMGYYMGIEPIFGALIFAVISSIAIAGIKNKSNTNADSLIGLFWAMGMALGILFIAFTPGYPPDISSYLFGDILTVTKTDLNLMLILDSLVIFLITAFYNNWKAYMFDREFSHVIGLNTKIMDYTLFVLIGLTIVVLIRVVGIILVIALLTAPPAIARFFTYNLKKIILLAVVLGMTFSLMGLWISYYFNIASGASIILLAGVCYMLVVFLRSNFLKLGYKSTRKSKRGLK